MSADLLPLLPPGGDSDVTTTTLSDAGVRTAAVSVGVVGSGHRPLVGMVTAKGACWTMLGMVTVKGAFTTGIIVDLGL